MFLSPVIFIPSFIKDVVARVNDLEEVFKTILAIEEDKDNYLILDTETTGLDSSTKVVSISIIDLQGIALYNSFVKPTIEISSRATEIHHIAARSLRYAPTFPEIYPHLQEIISNKKVIIYNSSYDVRVVNHCCQHHGLPEIFYKAPFCDRLDRDEELEAIFGTGVGTTQNYICLMLLYATFVGEWNDYKGGYRWQKLPNGDHTSLGDCFATHRIYTEMVQMARDYFAVEVPEDDIPF